jgi:hypothetical protein
MNGLTVGDGFKFGCGFLLAALIAWLAMAFIGGIVMALIGTVFGDILRNFDLLNPFLQLLGVF